MERKKIVMGAISIALAIGALIGYSVEHARASGIPPTQAMTYSGVLTDASGTPLTGSKNIQISIYDMATAGTLQCSAGPTALTLVGGGFQLALPDTCTTVVHGNPNLWIEVFADGASLGRTKLGAVPFAVEADHAKTADNATNATSATNATNASTASAAAGGLATSLTSLSSSVQALQSKAVLTTLTALYATSANDFFAQCVATWNAQYCGIMANRCCSANGYSAGWMVGETADGNASLAVMCIK